MNEEALNDAYQDFVDTGYNGSIDDFSELLKSNPEAFKDSYNSFVNTGYNGSEDDFSKLLGLETLGFIEKAKEGLKDGDINSVSEFGYALYDIMANRLPSSFKAGWAEQGGLEDQLQLYEEGKDIDDKTLQSIINNYNKAQYTPPSAAMKRFTEIYTAENKKLKEEDPESSDWWGFLKGAYEEPGVASELLIRSMAGQARAFLTSETARTKTLGSAVAGGGGALALGQLGPQAFLPEELVTVPSAMYIAGIGKLSQQMEIGNTTVELLENALEGQDFTLENVKKVLQNEEKFQDIQNKAWSRGTAIGTIEAITGGIAGKVAKLAKPAGRLAQVGVAATTEAVGGGFGEFVGQKAAGQETDVLEIGFESFAGMSTTPLSAGRAILGKKARYVVKDKDGKENVVSYSKMKKFIDTASDLEIAMADIVIENDNELASKAYKKQRKAILDSQIDDKITNKKDRDKLIELEAKRVKAEADVAKKGIDKVPNAGETLATIQAEIDAIIGKYEGAVGIGETQQAQQVADVVADKVFSANLEFAKKHSALYGLEVDDTMTLDQIAKYIKDNNIDPSAIESDGFIHKDKIIINKDVAKKTGAVNVGNHELLHGILRKAVKEGKINENLISDLKTKLGEKNWSKVEQRVKDGGYTQEYMNENQDEYLTLLSDAIAKNEIDFNEGLFAPIKDLLLPIFRAFGFKKINFETADSTYNFLKEYNKSIHKGALSSAIIKATGGKVDVSTAKPKQDLATQPSDPVKKQVYKFKNDDGQTVYAHITTAKDGSRKMVLYNSPTASFESRIGNVIKIEKGISNQKAVNANYFVDGEITLDNEIEGFENIARRKKELESAKMSKSNMQGVLDEYGGKEATKSDIRRMINETLMKTPQGQETTDITKSTFGQQIEPVVEAITKRLYDKIPNDATRAAGLTRADYKNALVSEAATITQQEYDATKQDLDKFISNRLNLRAESLAKRLGVQEKILKDIDFVTETDIDIDTKPKPKKEPKVVKKGRKLTSLADLDIESSLLIKEVTRAELKKLIQSNPKNLTEKIQEVLIPDLVEIIRQEMGVVGEKKGELVIPESYKAYLADTYEQTITSMEIQKIRSNYKNLFKKEKMGFADYKTKKSDKPSLKKDSNYVKDINKNITTKAEFTKYHTEGKKNKLIANQRNLAIMRAEAEAVRASENYIIDNSENLNEVYAAELRSFIDSKTVEKQKLEDKSFDTVQFSRSMAAGAFQIRDAVLTGENVFDNNGNLLAPYKNIVKNKKDSKAVGDFVYANMGLLTPKTEFKFLRKAYEKLYKSGKRGTAYETNLIETAIVAEKIFGKEALEVVLRKPTENDALPDIILKIHGEVMNIEAKMANAQYSSVTNSIVDGLMSITKQYSPEFTKILTDLQKESQKGIKRAQEFLKSQKLPITSMVAISFDNINEISNKGHYLLKNTIDPKTGKSYFNGMSATLPLPLKFISEIYNNKKHPVHLIQLMGRGLFSMGGDIFNLGIPALEDGGDGFITLRVGSNSKKRVATQADVNAGLVKSIFTDGTNTKKKGEKKTKRQVKTGMKSYSYRSIPGISNEVLNNMKSNRNIEQTAGLIKLMKSEEVALLKTKQEAKNKVLFSKSVNSSRSAFKKRFKKFQAQKQKAEKFVKDLKTREKFEKFQAQQREAKKFVESIRPQLKQPRGITILDFDDTLATTKSLVKYTTPEGETGTLNAEEYASTYEDLLDKGYTFDFSDFNKVVKGKLAPLFNKAMKLQGKFGPENMFVLTARPPQSQKAIFDFLRANGLNIPLENITGLGNSTAEAKALWVADKVGEGYNDFYFADDALQNVQAVKNMLDQFDVKSKVQQAKVKFSKSMDKDFNKILQDVTGIDADKRFSETKARKRGAEKGKFRFFIPPSHEDFVGLLYNFMGKGKKGNQHRNFFEQALVRPLNRAYREIDTAKQAIANDYKSLNKQFPSVKERLLKNTPDGDFTFQDAIRVYLWDKHGYSIPGLSSVDQKNLVDLVNNDADLKNYAETLNIISKQETYVDPGPNWETGNIRIDLVDATGRVGRASYFTEFNENAEIIFSPENLNKIEAAYGKGVREALEDMLHRIKTGINRPKGSSAKPNMFLNWLNASVSGVMFFNTRSALLQQLSNVNFLNFADNNIYAAGKAFANQLQYWKDFAMIFNSDMLKQRRGGIGTDINGAELAEAVKKARPDNLFDQVAIITGKALKLGFLPTQIGDSIAIATGGAAFYRNRVNKYINEGLSKKEAETKAFIDLQDITQSTQQSAKPYMTSAQQAMWIGKLVLNFLNTPSQYNRIIKKAGSDIINRRITPPNTTQLQSDMSNASRILYYGAAQNLIFYGLQTALFAVMFGLDDEDEEEKAEQFLKKKERVINGSIDTILRGSGIYGVAVSTIKNMAIKFLEQREKSYNKDESAVIMEMLNFSPVVGIKARKIVNAEKTLNYNKKIIDEMSTFDIDNPMWSAVTNYIEVAGPPANRIYQKTINLRNAMDNQYTAFQRAMFFSGYTTWSLGLGDTEKMKDIKQKVKSKKKSKSTKPLMLRGGGGGGSAR